jgi:SNF2 family DNA or RNA helicase
MRENGKVLELDRLLEDLIIGTRPKVIVWSGFVRSIKALAERYQQFGTVTLFGGTPAEIRQDIATQFQNDPATHLLIANPAAAGTGFTLTAASHAIYETLNWRYDHYAQSQDRNHRIGQTQAVTYTHLIAQDTIDEVIAAALRKKSVLARASLGDEVIPENVWDLTAEAFCEMLLSNKMPTDTHPASA